MIRDKMWDGEVLVGEKVLFVQNDEKRTPPHLQGCLSEKERRGIQGQ